MVTLGDPLDTQEKHEGPGKDAQPSVLLWPQQTATVPTKPGQGIVF